MTAIFYVFCLIDTIYLINYYNINYINSRESTKYDTH